MYLSNFARSKALSTSLESSKISKDLWFCEDQNICFNQTDLHQKYIQNPSSHPRLLVKDFYLQKFNHTRKEIIQRAKNTNSQIILEEKDKYQVPAIFIGDEKIYKVSIKFRGHDFMSRVDSPMTFKVNIEDQINTHFKGMSEFTIEDVEQRGGSFGILIQEKLRQEGNFVPRYYLIDTYLNDQLVKNTLYFEGFSKENQEYNKRSESFIYHNSGEFSLSQRSIFAKYKSENPQSTAKLIYVPSDGIVDITDSKRKNNSAILQKKYETGYQLLFGYVENNLTFEEVFNVKSFIPQIFYSELLCEAHGFIPNNVLYYYNPILRKLEPIVFDRAVIYSDVLYKQKMNKCNVNSYSIPKTVLSVKENYETEYKQYVKKILDEFNDGQFKSHKKQVEEKVNDGKILPNSFIKKRLEYLLNEKYDYKNKYLLNDRKNPNINNISIKQLQPQEYLIAYPLFIYVDDSDKYIYKYTIRNNLKKDVYLENIYYFNKNGKKQFILSGKKRIPPNHIIGQTQKLFKASKKKINAGRIFYDAYYYNDDGKKIVSTKIPVFPHVEPLETSAELKYQSLSIEEILKEFKFIRLHKVRKTFSISQTKSDVKKDIILPDGYSLEVKDSTLKFSEGTRIVLRNAPIQIINSNLTSKKESRGWLGLVILQSDRKSLIKNSHISNIKYIDGNILNDDWVLTGAITFYESDIDIINSHLNNNNTEDLLNIIRSKFLIKNSTLSNSVSDAFDSDFSNGKIINSNFTDIKGDAVDISGSSLHMSGGLISNIYDKALSIGERSNFTGDNIQVKNSGAGLVVKDNSVGVINNSNFDDIKESVYMSFIKKDEYGPAHLTATNSKATNYKDLYEVSTPSVLIIDNQNMTDKGKDLKSLYDSGRFKKIKW